jgi:hypothetical protein
MSDAVLRTSLRCPRSGRGASLPPAALEVCATCLSPRQTADTVASLRWAAHACSSSVRVMPDVGPEATGAVRAAGGEAHPVSARVPRSTRPDGLMPSPGLRLPRVGATEVELCGNLGDGLIRRRSALACR